jgi:lipopolysaccharide export system protein LptA
MPIQISRLRRWIAISAITLVLIVTGVYLYARWRVRNTLGEVTGKIGIEVQQTAQGFTVSRSEQGRTIFKIQASKAVQFKQGGRTELHDVTITLYGRDSSRFDQIYGADFEYDPRSGDVTAKGEVQIDLEANPEGLSKPDQATPKELKNPIHLQTSGLVFNQKTGDANTPEKVEFRIPQASGSAVGVSYVGKTNVLTMHSQVIVVFNGTTPATVTAVHGVITKNPRAVVLDDPRVLSPQRKIASDKATLFLDSDNKLQRVLATGNVQIDSQGPAPAGVRAAQLELLLGEQNDTVKTAILSGDVHVERSGPQALRADAGRVVLDMAGKNVVSKVHAENNVKLFQVQKPPAPSANPQELEVAAPALDFFLAGGRRLERAETLGAHPQITIRPAGARAGQQTVATAARFEAHFDKLGRLASVHGAPDAHVTSSSPGQPDRTSNSDTLDAAFHPGTGIESIVQQGNLAYTDGDRKAWADRARYTPADQMLVLEGSPRVIEGGMTTTARTMRVNRTTGDAIADGDVKSTYSDLKPQPGGALLASASPIHVTARSMTAHRTPSIALYTGDARLWQDANVVRAPSIEFDRQRRAVTATGTPAQTVSTVFLQTDKSGKPTLVTISSARLTYTDNERIAHFESGVVAKADDANMTANAMDVFLQARGPASGQPEAGGNNALGKVGQLDKIVAKGQVVVTQPNRRATCEQMVYTAAEDKFVLTGGTPSIFDAEHGKITGVSLTFFRRDDRVLVEGNGTSPTVTQTRVAR